MATPELEVEPAADGSVVVRGLPLAEVRRRLAARRRGRPPVGVDLRPIERAIGDRVERELPVTALDVADDLGISRRTLGRRLDDAGMSWDEVRALFAPADPDAPGMLPE